MLRDERVRRVGSAKTRSTDDHRAAGALAKREKHMLKSKGRLGLAALACVGLAIVISTPVAAWERGTVQTFGLVGAPMVEGFRVDSNGNVYTATFNPVAADPDRAHKRPHPRRAT